MPWSSTDPLSAPPNSPSSASAPSRPIPAHQPHASGQRCPVREPRQRPVHVDHDDEDHGSSATPAMKDCMETLGDSVSELQESLTAMGRLGGKSKRFRISNMQTWVSAALTDD
ncbi:hypothetical protein C4D60_Mb05t04400 [Musa balbisiana]|uniref:Pectinesterase inhibitor domain-containing protein n=1 Tax=Musa balbisiana TaxID=52838 RepID=A0A4S8JTP1_MUSBA|nr:hypothetical protein C4D60_Mb05t04400 [Musa balbisiana]